MILKQEYQVTIDSIKKMLENDQYYKADILEIKQQ